MWCIFLQCLRGECIVERNKFKSISQSKFYPLSKKNSWISFVENDSQIKSLHLKDDIIATGDKHIACKMKTNSQCCFTKKDAQSNLKRTIGFVNCDNPNHTLPLHFECFQHLVMSKCNGKFLFQKDNNGIESICIACGKRCYNLMKKDSALTNIKETDKTSKPNSKPILREKAKINWSNNGTGQFLVEYISDEVNNSKYFGTKDTAEKDDQFGKDDGCSKLTICKVISGLMEKETNVNRPAKAIQAKIRHLVSQFKVTLDKSCNTGHGIKAEGGEMNY